VGSGENAVNAVKAGVNVYNKLDRNALGSGDNLRTIFRGAKDYWYGPSQGGQTVKRNVDKKRKRTRKNRFLKK
jgi:hypothetical protein